MDPRGGLSRRSAALLTTIGLIVLPMRHVSSTGSDTRQPIRQLLLDNGLQLVWEEDHRQPLVAIEARIKGGLRGEGAYVGTGITHFIEHMLFKGTPSRPAGTIEQEVRRYGGTINAFTSFDTTGVSLFVESRSLREALGLLADILQHAVFEPKEFEKERAVIISEIQMNLDDPDRRLTQAFWSRHFLEHPYRHPILGYQPLLERLTVKDLTSFYAAEYQPQHIVISCVGDVESGALTTAAKAIFGAWPRGTTDPAQQLVPAEPPAASAKTVSVELPVQSAYAILGFSSTRLSDPDVYPLDVLANILGDGRSSRLYETIVRRRQLADAIAAWDYTPYDPGVFGIQFRTDPSKVADATAAILQVVDEVQQHGVTPQELGKAKHGVTADYLFSLQTVESKAGDLANSLMATGDPLFSRRYVEGIGQVTAEQVQEVARRYCNAARMTSAVVRPAAQPEALVASPPAARSPVTKTVLGNGATVLIGEDPHLPIAAIVVAFHGGVRVETDADQGLSNLVAQMLIKGTERKGALQIAQAVESLGASLEPFSGRDGFGLVLQLLAQDVDKGLALVHELISQSTFPDEELAVQQRIITSQLQAQDDEIFEVGGRLLRRELFSGHPYRFNAIGDRQTVGQLTRADCVAFAKQWAVPSNMVIAVFGDVQPAAVHTTLTSSFGALSDGKTSWPAELGEAPIQKILSVSQTMDKEQALIMLGFRGCTHRAEDRYALEVMTTMLSGMAGRLFQAVREAQGLSYTLGAVNVTGWDPGSLIIYAATRPKEEQKVLEAIQAQLRLAVERGFTEEEVEQAKRYLIGSQRLELQDLAGWAKRSTLDELYGLGFDAWTTYEAKINAVTPAMVHDAARHYLTTDRYAEVVVSPNGHAR